MKAINSATPNGNPDAKQAAPEQKPKTGKTKAKAEEQPGK
jgi:hypothetical protein